MTVALATICLNEMEWLPKLYEQHKDWPDMLKWVFVEGCDRSFYQVNGDIVTDEGLSTDGTTEFLQDLASKDSRVEYIPFGFSDHEVQDQGKAPLRQAYLEVLKEVAPTYMIVVDADEFYTKEHQLEINNIAANRMKAHYDYQGIVFRRIDIWCPPAMPREDLFKWQIRGKLWSIPSCRIWKWYPDLSHENDHDTPWRTTLELPTSRVGKKLCWYNRKEYDHPVGIHMGWTCLAKSRAAKNEYYVERGEGSIDHRLSHVVCRQCFFDWKDHSYQFPFGDVTVRKYLGPIPECFL